MVPAVGPDGSCKEKSVELWQSVFGEAFKKTAELKLLQGSSAPRALHDPEQDIEADLRFSIALRYPVKLVGRVEKKDGFRHYNLPTRSNIVAKNRQLVFSVDTRGIAGNFEIYWKVRNSGEEAIHADQLRGQIFKGGRHHLEWTRYKGSHYVEVYIVPGDVCVALDRQRVVVK